MSKFPFKKKEALALSVGLVIGAMAPQLATATPESEKAPKKHLPGDYLPTGKRITPEAAPLSHLQTLNPGLPTRPDYLADHAVDNAISPDGKTLLVLTSGYNLSNDSNPASKTYGNVLPAESNEYVFIYDISGTSPVKKQVVQVPNTFNGIAWNPNGTEFYVSGGKDDNLHLYALNGGQWKEADKTIPLGHNKKGEGAGLGPVAAGVAVNQSGTLALVANYENDSVSLIDLKSRAKVGELDLRPGKTDASKKGTPGGTFPLAVAFKGDNKAYVSSQRDRELIVVGVNGNQLAINNRIKTQGQPNKMTLNRAQDRLYVASDNSDTVLVIDTQQDGIVEEILTTAPAEIFPDAKVYKGANPNNVALSPDEKTLFVTNGGTNSLAVIQLAQNQPISKKNFSRVVGLIPTGWYPSAVSVKPDSSALYVVNSKSISGPNKQGCRDTLSIDSAASKKCNASNQYAWQLEKAGLLTLPVPPAKDLAQLTWQVAYNNQFPAAKEREKWKSTMAFLRKQIKHVIYVVKENRTYDQVHGALPKGNGEPDLAILAPYAPNHNNIATQFVLLDNFYDSGETSGVGWNWTTAARTTDFTEKTQPVNYAGRGLTYDWEGYNRNVAVSMPTVAERKILVPNLPDDPDLLAGTADVAAPDSRDGEAGTGYLWDAALRAGLSIRNYGFYTLNISNNAADLSARPFQDGIKQVKAVNKALVPYTDEYFRAYDQAYPDFYRFKEWEREFDGYVKNNNLPNLTLFRISHDHFGSFASAKFGVNTVEAQMSDNDYAFGRLVEKLAKSPFKNDTLIFVVEDDAQNGGDHVDSHRSIAYVVGPYVSHGTVVSKPYTTVSMLRTIEEVLGLKPLGINDGLTAPMAEVFNTKQKTWDYDALVPAVLYGTAMQADLPPKKQAPIAKADTPCLEQAKRDADYWAAAMEKQDFSVEDRLDTDDFNHALWVGLKGEKAAYPEERHGRDMRLNRAALLQKHKAALLTECKAKLASAE